MKITSRDLELHGIRTDGTPAAKLPREKRAPVRRGESLFPRGAFGILVAVKANPDGTLEQFNPLRTKP